MITRSNRDSNYEFLELPDKKGCRKDKKEVPVATSTVVPTETQDPPVQSSAHMQSAVDDYNKSQNETSIHSIPYRPLYEVNIDFDEAHREWVKNKIKMPNGCYKYRKERTVKKRNTKTM